MLNAGMLSTFSMLHLLVTLSQLLKHVRGYVCREVYKVATTRGLPYARLDFDTQLLPNEVV
jgi:hypothetical protein